MFSNIFFTNILPVFNPWLTVYAIDGLSIFSTGGILNRKLNSLWNTNPHLVDRICKEYRVWFRLIHNYITYML